MSINNSYDKTQSKDTDSEYQEAIDYLYSQLPMFSRVGAAAYKPGLERTETLDSIFNHPHKKFKSIHIAGTNGKGSTSHMLASILMAHGYKTALYTSPHLVDFRERIKINGKMIPKERVVDFTRKWKELKPTSGIEPSFFELTMIMAFDWFAQENVDYAIIEVGMGGRLDSTNIISPELCIITNISPDHMQFLGDTMEKIAFEKAGIIKSGIPIIIGEAEGAVREVFKSRATKMKAPIYEAFEHPEIVNITQEETWGWNCESKRWGNFNLPLAGVYQMKNVNTVAKAVRVLTENGMPLTQQEIRSGFENVVTTTGLMGRWMKVTDSPLTICDTGHNEAGIKNICAQLQDIMQQKGADAKLRMVIGFVADKDVEHILSFLPQDAKYYITQAAIPRAMKSEELAYRFRAEGIEPVAVFDSVKEAAARAVADAAADDVVFIGGSTFIVADFLK